MAQLLLQEISQTVSAPSKLGAELDRVLSQNKLDMGGFTTLFRVLECNGRDEICVDMGENKRRRGG